MIIRSTVRPLVVGVTGGIGSGKSAVTGYLEKKGIKIVDADLIARAVVEPGTKAYAEIVQHFGSEILQPDGTLDRRALRKIVFSDSDRRLWLESVTHPAIAETIAAQLEAAAPPYVVLSSAILLETEQSDSVDTIVVVDVPESIQISRAGSRDNTDGASIKRIIAAQMSRADRCALADHVIDNSGNLADLSTAVDDLHQKLLQTAEEHLQDENPPT